LDIIPCLQFKEDGILKQLSKSYPLIIKYPSSQRLHLFNDSKS